MSEVVRQKRNGISRNRIISIIILICSIVCLIYCGGVIADYTITKRENTRLNKQKDNLALKYEYYRTLVEEDDYKVIISDGKYCYEADSNKTYKCG